VRVEAGRELCFRGDGADVEAKSDIFGASRPALDPALSNFHNHPALVCQLGRCPLLQKQLHKGRGRNGLRRVRDPTDAHFREATFSSFAAGGLRVFFNVATMCRAKAAF